jgi:hypothetical protein
MPPCLGNLVISSAQLLGFQAMRADLNAIYWESLVLCEAQSSKGLSIASRISRASRRQALVIAMEADPGPSYAWR